MYLVFKCALMLLSKAYLNRLNGNVASALSKFCHPESLHGVWGREGAIEASYM